MNDTATASREFSGGGRNGFAFLGAFFGVVALAALAGLAGMFSPVMTALAATVLMFSLLLLAGFYMLQPNEAAAITLFGAYRGSDRSPGLR